MVGNIRKSQERTEKMNKTLVFAIVAGMLLSLTGAVIAESHSWYFSQSGNDSTGDGSIGNPWKSLSKAQNEINNADADEIVNLFFKRGDTWSFDSIVRTIVHGLWIGSDDPTVNIDSYGSGAKPIFDGGVTDFSTAPVHDTVNGPLRWSAVFRFEKDNCSVKNVEITNVYGNVINLHNANTFTLGYSDINNFGQSGILDGEACACGVIVEHNTFHTGQQLWRYGLRPSGWGAAISLQDESAVCNDNLIRHNLVYDIFGEGIISLGGIVEYNVVGNTYSTAIYQNGKDGGVAEDIIFRYNLVVMSGSSDYQPPYPIPSIHDGRAAHNGIGVVDENMGGDNTSADIEIYGNIVINRKYGIYVKNPADPGNPIKSIKIYNNLVIDCSSGNYIISQPEEVTNGYIYNNSSILYDRTEAIHGGYGSRLPHANWTIDNNHFWTTGGSPTVDDGWDDNYVITDPKLPGEPSVDWDGQTGPTYFSDIDFNTHLYPSVDSALVGAGKTLDDGFDNKLLTKGTKWSDSPGITAQLAEQSVGDWDIGASKYSVVPNADINNDGKVNIEDFAVMAVWWDDDDGCVWPGWCGGADFNMNGTVDMFDLGYFTENWLR